MNELHSLYNANVITEHSSLKINKKTCKKDKVSYEIWNYDNNYISFDEKQDTLLCRSVVFSYPEKKLLAYSPGKTIQSKKFCNKYTDQNQIYINEYIDGTLIHLFYDSRIKSWEIGTKSAISGKYFLSNNIKKSSKNVRNMFIESLTCEGMTSEHDLHSIELLKDFSKNYSYTFVMLHPDNVIIYPITTPMLYLVSVYDITPKTKKFINIPQSIFENWDFFQNTTILFPKSKTIDNWSELENLSLFQKNQDLVGYMAIHLPSGERCKFINPTYEELKKIKKLDSQYVLHYLCFQRMNLIDKYLSSFPQFRKMFYTYKKHCDEFIENLHTAYLVKFVWRNTKDRIHEKYEKYINDIHRDIYLPSIKTEKKIITRKVVHNYIMNKPPGEILYSLYYEKRFILRKI
jgi:hypothetical protein|tara:strand:- start:1056 stop:2264 length:1209 start_codon:yes stop_codon:yes gene_type:complete